VVACRQPWPGRCFAGRGSVRASKLERESTSRRGSSVPDGGGYFRRDIPGTSYFLSRSTLTRGDDLCRPHFIEPLRDQGVRKTAPLVVTGNAIASTDQKVSAGEPGGGSSTQTVFSLLRV